MDSQDGSRRFICRRLFGPQTPSDLIFVDMPRHTRNVRKLDRTEKTGSPRAAGREVRRTLQRNLL